MEDYYFNLFRYTRWANRRVAEALRANPAATAEGLPLFAHVVAAEHNWLFRMLHQEPQLAIWPQLTLDECAAWIDKNAAGYETFLGGLGTGGLTTEVDYRNSAGVAYRNTVGDILTHVVTHGGYHRGQVAKAVGRSGGKAVNTDYIMFLREAPNRGA